MVNFILAYKKTKKSGVDFSFFLIFFWQLALWILDLKLVEKLELIFYFSLNLYRNL